MTILIPFLFLLTAASGTAVVLVRDPARQIFAIAANGVVLAILFTALQAPDVALSEIAVGGAAVPLLFLVALMAVRAGKVEQAADKGHKE